MTKISIRPPILANTGQLAVLILLLGTMIALNIYSQWIFLLSFFSPFRASSSPVSPTPCRELCGTPLRTHWSVCRRYPPMYITTIFKHQLIKYELQPCLQAHSHQLFNGAHFFFQCVTVTETCQWTRGMRLKYDCTIYTYVACCAINSTVKSPFQCTFCFSAWTAFIPM